VTCPVLLILVIIKQERMFSVGCNGKERSITIEIGKKNATFLLFLLQQFLRNILHSNDQILFIQLISRNFK
jgi:hypothetical protein